MMIVIVGLDDKVHTRNHRYMWVAADTRVGHRTDNNKSVPIWCRRNGKVHSRNPEVGLCGNQGRYNA